ncbi:cyclin domain fused to cyclin-dependent serine/threonine protein kinase [Cotonvirus japonicus]|uniref:Cyclin domain fused to cyclin-dependent serine/threonine protein kinase n=1 Tax=Cotonvirus japonicus TaxID=2811091 RepID=A0ABM7NRR1_9VIRU|nr:cyclin domain fused to cyclin-dependent serine/threonine protein kinase [Cotonvirus japonicus]BCS82848.1 cyclin domain fused to cyclin-dependent serine/threonine protein kinase [Cotonvirus japonicus]
MDNMTNLQIINPNSNDNEKHQHYLSFRKRIILLNWLMKIVNLYRLRCHTFQLAVLIMDKFLLKEQHVIDTLNIQAVGLICLGLASKVEEVIPLGLKDYMNICNESYSQSFLIKLECRVLRKLCYCLYNNTIWQYVKLYAAQRKISSENFYLAYFLSNITLLSNEYLQYSSQQIAQAIINTCIILNTEPESLQFIIENEPEYEFIYNNWKNITLNYPESVEIFSSELKLVNLSIIPPDIKLSNIKSLKINNENNLPIGTNNYLYKKEIMNNIEIFQKLGAGAYGSVHHIKYNNKNIAMKVIKTSKKDISPLVLREINNMMLLNHPNVLKLDGFLYDSKQTTMYIGLELMQMSLTHKIVHENLSETQKSVYIMQLLEGLCHIHSSGIMHRDLCGNNVLISHNDTIKISDFGMSRYYCNSIFTTAYSGNICSIYYRPIELFLNVHPYTEKIDVWSCACVIGLILTGSDLFMGNDEKDVLLNIYKTLGTPNKYFFKSVNKTMTKIFYPKTGFIDLEDKYPGHSKILYQMLEYDPDKRLTIFQATEMFKQLLNY